jgi:hypothetical protein
MMSRAPEHPPVAQLPPSRPERREPRRALSSSHLRYLLGTGLMLVVAAFLVAYCAAI